MNQRFSRFQNNPNASTKPKNKISPLSFNTLRGRIFLFIAVCISALLIFTVTIYVQNRNTLNATQKVKELRVPIPILITDIVGGANSAAAAQRAYLMTNDKKFKEERKRLWREVINVSLNRLLLLKESLSSDTLKRDLEQAEELIQNYKAVQEDIDNFFENYYDDLSDYALIQDSTFASLKKRIDNKNAITKELYDKVSKDATIAREDIRKLLTPLLETQKFLLNEEIQGIEQNIDVTRITILLISTLVLIFAFSFAYVTFSRLRQSVQHPTRLLNKLANGELPREVESTKDEMTEVITAGNRLSKNLRKASNFAQDVGEGQFDSDFQPVSNKDVLGNSLIQMRDRLKQVSIEDKKRNWVTQGLAKFAEIIRANDDDFETLGDTVLAALIEYVGANQGGLYIAREVENDLVILDMIACYAFNRKKYQTKQIKVYPDYAETLLGQTYLEKERIYMTELPDDYIKITSGLGDAPPRNLLLIPIKGPDQVEGVLEVAAFSKFDNFQIEFIEKISESLAAAIRSVKVNEHTQILVKELQEQTEAMRAQEEEMRQNMEELTSTQEQMRKKQNELESLKVSLETEVQRRTRELQDSLTRFNLINQSSSEGLWDMSVNKDKKIDQDSEIYWSKNLINSLGFQSEEFPNTLSSWITRLHPEDKEKTFQEFIAHLQDRSNQTVFLNEHRLKTKSGTYRWFKASCKTLRDTQGNPIRVAGYINDVTHQKELHHAMHELRMQKAELERKQNELQSFNDKIRNNEMVLKKAFEKMRKKEKELKEKNKILAVNEVRFKSIVENTPGIIFQMMLQKDMSQAQLTFASDYVKEVLGLSPEEFTSLEYADFQALIHPDDKLDYLAQLKVALDEMINFEWEGRLQEQNKEWKWLKINASLNDTGKDMVQLDGTIVDITSQKEQRRELEVLNNALQANEEELRQNLEELQTTQEKMATKQEELVRLTQRMESNERILLKSFEKIRIKEKELKLRNEELHTIINSSRKAVVLTDPDRNIMLINQTAERIFGYSEGELLDKKIDNLFAPKYLGEMINIWNSNGDLHNQDAYKAELRSEGLTKEGATFPIFISMKTDYKSDKKLSVAFIEDLSQKDSYSTSNS